MLIQEPIRGLTSNSLLETAEESAQSLLLAYAITERYYDPVVGRFISEDPIRQAGGDNLQQYAGNDPINRQDPSGHWTFDYASGAITVQAGDTVSDISLALTGSMDFRHMLRGFSDPDHIKPGDVLHLAPDVTLLSVTEEVYKQNFRNGPAWESLGEGEVKEGRKKRDADLRKLRGPEVLRNREFRRTSESC